MSFNHSFGKLSKIKQLELENAKLKKKNMALSNQFLGASAEIQDTNHMASKNQAELKKYKSQDIAKDILPCIDDLERATQVNVQGSHQDNGEQLKQGVQMVIDHLNHALEVNGIHKIDVKAGQFNPEIEEAVAVVDTKGQYQPDDVIKVLQDGYKIHNRILRPARVVVSK